MKVSVNLETLREMINHNTNFDCENEIVWIDYGAKLMSMTLVAVSRKDRDIGMNFQMLSPEEINKALGGRMTIKEALKIVEKYQKKGNEC